MLAGLLFDMGEKGVEAFQKIQHMAETTRRDFDDLHDKAQVNIDDIDLQNSKLQDQIDKIEGHPNNGFATALIEAKRAGDALLVSLAADRKELDELLKAHDTGKFGAALAVIGAGAATTGAQNDQLRGDQDKLSSQITNAGRERDAAFSKAQNPKDLQAATDKYKAAVHNAYQSQIDSYRKESGRLKAEQKKSEDELANSDSPYGRAINNSAKIAQIEGRGQQLIDKQMTLDAGTNTNRLTQRLGQDKQDKATDKDGKTGDDGARKALEAQRKAAEAQRQQWDLDHDMFEQAKVRTAADEVAFWTARVKQAGVGRCQLP